MREDVYKYRIEGKFERRLEYIILKGNKFVMDEGKEVGR